MTDKPNKNSLREAAREKAVGPFLREADTVRFTIGDSFRKGYDAGYQDASAQPSGPGDVCERPKESGEYWVTTTAGEVLLNRFVTGMNYWEPKPTHEIIAWMPREPKPAPFTPPSGATDRTEREGRQLKDEMRAEDDLGPGYIE